MKDPNIELIYFKHNKKRKNIPSINSHILLFNEITFVLEGKLIYYVDNIRYELNSGDAIFIKNGQKRAREEQKELTNYISFNFLSPEELNLKTYLSNIIDKELQLSFLYYDEMISNKTSVNLKVKNLLLNILDKLKNAETKSNLSALTQSIIEILNSKKYSKINLQEISKKTYFTISYCQRQFKKDTGHTILNYFNTIKIEKAKELIMLGEKSLNEISEILGFDDYNYFSRLFKKISKLSPKDYQKRWIKNI